jgi:CrcB protein
MIWMWVAAGAALGGVLRYGANAGAGRLGMTAFPWATLFVNVLGSAVIGFFATVTGDQGRIVARPELRMFVMAGVCGGFTTFSSFSLETLKLIEDREWMLAGLNAGGSLVLCLLAVFVGAAAGTMVNQK